MKGFGALLVLVLLAWTPSALSDPSVQAWSISVTGGINARDTSASFYEEARDYHSDFSTFKIPESNRYEFFGQSDGLKCVQSFDFPYKGKTYNVLNLFRKYSESPACSDFVLDPIIADLTAESQIVCNRAPSSAEIKADRSLQDDLKIDPRLGYLDGADPILERKGGAAGTFVPSTASRKNFMSSVRKVESSRSQSKSDRHLLLVLNDHGTISVTGSDLTFGFGNGDKIKGEELKQITDRLAKEGINVHLVADTCYSGLLNRLTKTDATGADVCTVANADASTDSISLPGAKGWPEALGEYGDQIEALGCLSGDNSLNRYTSGLDEVVRKWEETQADFRWPDCSDVTSLKDLQSSIESLKRTVTSGVSIQQERRELISAYFKYYITPMRQCMNSSTHMYDRAFSWLSGCANKLGQKDLADFLNEVNQSYIHSAETVARHLNFLKNAPPEQLSQFKSVFCCLGFNFKTLKYPKVCGSGS